MTELVLDVRRGATAAALLGALVEAGASLEAIDHAVSTLGEGAVPIQVQTAAGGTAVVVRAPQGAPTVDTWARLRPRVALLALDEAIVEAAVAILDALFAARAQVHGVPVADIDVDPFSGPDDLANAIALAAATTSVSPSRRVRVTAVGHGTGRLETIEGNIELPGPVVATLLAALAPDALDTPFELVDPIGAAYLVAVAAGGAVDSPDQALGTRGRGRLPDGASVVAALASAG